MALFCFPARLSLATKWPLICSSICQSPLINVSRSVRTPGGWKKDFMARKEEERQLKIQAEEEAKAAALWEKQQLARIQGQYFKVSKDPKETSILLFPGEGSQHIGMAENLLDYPNVPEMFEVAERILGYDLLDVCMSGDSSLLNRIDIAQAAVVVSSLASVEKLRFQNPNAIENCFAAGGNGCGEITALMFARAISYEDGIRLIKIRGEAMKRTAANVNSGLLRVLLKPDAKIKLAMQGAIEHCNKKDVHPEFAICQISHYMYPHCKIIGGHSLALDWLIDNAQDFGIKDCRMLTSSGAYYTRFMRPVTQILKQTMSKMRIEQPLISVHSCYDGKRYRNEEAVKNILPLQASNPLKIEQMYHSIYERPKDLQLPMTYECGPGYTMMDLLERNNARAKRQMVSITA